MSAKIRVTKQFNFESAHALWNYDGKCKNIHGHTYKLFITVIGNVNTDTESPKNGMVMDFGDLKYLVMREIVNVYDHAVILNENAPYGKLLETEQMFDRFITTSYQPTCENMVADFAEKLRPFMPAGISIHNIRLYETETSYAEWFASDNL